MMLDGKPVAAQDALSLGAIDAMVPADDIIEAAAEWIRGGGDGVARWDRPGFRPPGGAVFDPAIAADFAFLSASTHRQGDENYPAKLAILKCVYEGLLVPIDAGLRIETRYFVQTLATPQAKAMVRSLFLSSQILAKGGARPAGFPAFAPRTVAIIGAGMMGAGIAHVQAQNDIRTILIDVSDDIAAKGKAHSRKLLDRAIARGQTIPEEADRRLALIEPTADYGRIADADLVIESVFEDRAVKTAAIAKAEAYMRPGAIFASNTSALPIKGLAAAAKRPANFIGIHFFSPVERMALVEIVVGRETAPATVAAACDYALALGKTPIRVNDGRRLLHHTLLRDVHRRGHRIAARRHRAGVDRQCRPPDRHAARPLGIERRCRARSRPQGSGPGGERSRRRLPSQSHRRAGGDDGREPGPPWPQERSRLLRLSGGRQ